jgi:DNA polymerase V
MGGIARAPQELIYRIFGVNGELLIDHAWGREPCTIEDIKSYKSKSQSVSFSQILMQDYDYEKAKLVILEMTLSGCQEMMRRKVITNNVGIYVGYSKEVIPATGGTVKMSATTNVFSVISEYVERLFADTTKWNYPIRRLGISFNNVVDEGCEGYDLFTNFEEVEKEKHLEQTVLHIKERFGKNAILRGFDLQEGATTVVRNKLIGGHNSE